MIRRITSQVTHAKNIFLHVIGGGPAPSPSQRAGLVRDNFGLHKMIVVVTRSGKIFGIDNISGKFHWIKYLPNFSGFNEDQGLQLIVQRTSKYFPLSAQCSVIGKHKKTGNGIIFQFNPINGQPIQGDGTLELTYPIQQIAVLHQLDANFLKGLILMDNNNHIHVLPEASNKLAEGIYMYTADRNTGIMNGFVITLENNVSFFFCSTI